MILKKIFSLSTLTLLTALTLSGIAAWYSILGLVAIFAAAAMPIIIMGASLEVAKVVSTMWLQRYWHKARFLLKLYLVIAVVGLAFLTSVGIFGFLSKAHIDQGVPSGDIASQLALFDEKIKIERENIENARSLITQLDGVVNAMTTGTDRTARRKDGSEFTISSAERALSTRRSQAKDRASLTKQIEEAQQNIVKLQVEKAPIASTLRKAEAEVGPIKYIAALIYGDNPDQVLLEKAVRWMIILIVFVFDPLALSLVLAANASRIWLNEELDIKPDPIDKQPEIDDIIARRDGLWSDFTAERDRLEQMLDDVEPPARGVEEEVPSSHPIPEEIAPIEKPTNPEIVTDGVTTARRFKELPFDDRPGDYVVYDGKQIHRGALKEMHPEFFAGLSPDAIAHKNSGFGISFPKIANVGDTFVRVDTLPNKAYEFDGVRWVEIVAAEVKTAALTDEQVRQLISQIDNETYPVDLLTDSEKSSIEAYLKSDRA